jgi:hypothetical protein
MPWRLTTKSLSCGERMTQRYSCVWSALALQVCGLRSVVRNAHDVVAISPAKSSWRLGYRLHQRPKAPFTKGVFKEKSRFRGLG